MEQIYSLAFWSDFVFLVQQKSDFCSFEGTPWILGVDELGSFHLLVDEHLHVS